jgi:hypothetical protein
MFARTKVAKEFRKWVLDVLDSLTPAPAPKCALKDLAPPKTKKALPGCLTVEQQDAVKALVRSRADAIEDPNRRGAATIKCWSAIKTKFGKGYKEVEAEHFTEALSLVARLPLEGEHIPANRPEQLTLPIFHGESGERFLVILEGDGRYSVSHLSRSTVTVDMSRLLVIDAAMDAWREFAKDRDLSFYRARESFARAE